MTSKKKRGKRYLKHRLFEVSNDFHGHFDGRDILSWVEAKQFVNPPASTSCRLPRCFTAVFSCGPVFSILLGPKCLGSFRIES